jgi:hypothetical protein
MRIRPYKRVSRGEPDVCEAVPPGATPAAVVGHDDLARLDQVGPLRRDGLEQRGARGGVISYLIRSTGAHTVARVWERAPA